MSMVFTTMSMMGSIGGSIGSMGSGEAQIVAFVAFVALRMGVGFSQNDDFESIIFLTIALTNLNISYYYNNFRWVYIVYIS
jgi:hypothetical protein